MKRLFAYRPILFCALTLCLGILIGFFIATKSLIGIVLSVSIFAILPIFLVIFYIAKFYEKRKGIVALPARKGFANFVDFVDKFKRIMAILICFAILGLSLFNIAIKAFESNQYSSLNCVLTGTITKSVADRDSYMTFYMRDCVAYDDTGNKHNIDGIIRVSSSVTQSEMPAKVELGLKISFKTTIKAVSIVGGKGIDAFSYKFNIKHTCNLYESNKDSIIISRDSATFAEMVDMYVLNMLLDSMPEEEAYLAWSVLFGDSTQLDENVLEAFKVSGVMHIIAVSGMNVVFIVAILFGIMKLVRVKNRKMQFFTVLIVLFLYCYLCAFTSSVLRASFMAMVFLYAKLFGKNGDMLSNIGFCALILLIIQPLMLFEAGFLLSFASLLGIILLNPPILKFFKKLHCPNALALSLSTTISAQLGVYPILASMFGYVSTYSFIANLVVVPIFELTYSILFVLVIVVAIIPAFSFLLTLLASPFAFINWFPTLFVPLPYATMAVFGLGIFAVAYYLLMFFLSPYSLIHGVWKKVICIILSIILALGIASTYFVKSNDYIQNLDNRSGYSSLILDKDQNILVGMGNSYRDAKTTDDYLKIKRIFNLDYMIMWEQATASGVAITNFEKIATKYNPKCVFLTNEYANNYELVSNLKQNGTNVVEIPNYTAISSNNITLKLFKSTTAYAIYIQTINYNFFFITSDASSYNLKELDNFANEKELKNYVVIYENKILYYNYTTSLSSLI